MTSTVLDVTVLLLCVSASVVTLGATGNDIGGADPTAAEVADQLVTETVTVRYRSADAPNGTRTVHATRAELLGALVSERSDESVASATDERFGSRARAVISDGVGRRTRIDATATVASADGGVPAPSDRPAAETLRLATNGPRLAARPPSEQGIPSRLGGDLDERSDPNAGGGTSGDEGERTGSVAVGDEPPRNADVTATVVTQPAPIGMDDVESVRIVVRRW